MGGRPSIITISIQYGPLDIVPVLLFKFMMFAIGQSRSYRQHLVGRLYCWLLLATAAYCWLRLALQRAARQVDRTDMRVGRR